MQFRWDLRGEYINISPIVADLGAARVFVAIIIVETSPFVNMFVYGWRGVYERVKPRVGQGFMRRFV